MLLNLKKKHSLFLWPPVQFIPHGYTPHPMAGIEADLVRHALQIARDSGFTEVELSFEQDSFRATLEPNGRKPKPSVSSEAPAGDKDPESSIKELKSSQVGYFRPGDSPLQVGQRVEKGQKVGVISALGLFNDVESSVSGEVVEVLVADGDPVQYGQPLARVQP